MEQERYYEITFGNHLQSRIKITSTSIEVLDAVNGWGDPVPISEVKIMEILNNPLTEE